MEFPIFKKLFVFYLSVSSSWASSTNRGSNNEDGSKTSLELTNDLDIYPIASQNTHDCFSPLSISSSDEDLFSSNEAIIRSETLHFPTHHAIVQSRSGLRVPTHENVRQKRPIQSRFFEPSTAVLPLRRQSLAMPPKNQVPITRQSRYSSSDIVPQNEISFGLLLAKQRNIRSAIRDFERIATHLGEPLQVICLNVASALFRDNYYSSGSALLQETAHNVGEETYEELVYQAAMHELADHQHGIAFRLFETAAYEDHAKSQFQLGRCTRNGIGVDKDSEVSYSWFRKVLRNNDLEAQIMLVKFVFEKDKAYNEALDIMDNYMASESVFIASKNRKLLGDYYFIKAEILAKLARLSEGSLRADYAEKAATAWRIYQNYKETAAKPFQVGAGLS